MFVFQNRSDKIVDDGQTYTQYFGDDLAKVIEKILDSTISDISVDTDSLDTNFIQIMKIIEHKECLTTESVVLTGISNTFLHRLLVKMCAVYRYETGYFCTMDISCAYQIWKRYLLKTNNVSTYDSWLRLSDPAKLAIIGFDKDLYQIVMRSDIDYILRNLHLVVAGDSNERNSKTNTDFYLKVLRDHARSSDNLILRYETAVMSIFTHRIKTMDHFLCFKGLSTFIENSDMIRNLFSHLPDPMIDIKMFEILLDQILSLDDPELVGHILTSTTGASFFKGNQKVLNRSILKVVNKNNTLLFDVLIQYLDRKMHPINVKGRKPMSLPKKYSKHTCAGCNTQYFLGDHWCCNVCDDLYICADCYEQYRSRDSSVIKRILKNHPTHVIDHQTILIKESELGQLYVLTLLHTARYNKNTKIFNALKEIMDPYDIEAYKKTKFLTSLCKGKDELSFSFDEDGSVNIHVDCNSVDDYTLISRDETGENFYLLNTSSSRGGVCTMTGLNMQLSLPRTLRSIELLSIGRNLGTMTLSEHLIQCFKTVNVLEPDKVFCTVKGSEIRFLAVSHDAYDQIEVNKNGTHSLVKTKKTHKPFPNKLIDRKLMQVQYTDITRDTLNTHGYSEIESVPKLWKISKTIHGESYDTYYVFEETSRVLKSCEILHVPFAMNVLAIDQTPVTKISQGIIKSVIVHLECEIDLSKHKMYVDSLSDRYNSDVGRKIPCIVKIVQDMNGDTYDLSILMR